MVPCHALQHWRCGITNGGVTFLNPVAESLTGWTQEDAAGKSPDTVFKIINEETRHTVENPATRALREGVCRRAAWEKKAG